MARELEITDEFRKQIAAKTEEALKHEGLNPDRIEVWEDGYRTAEREDAFEWWYFDLQLDDGSTLVITYSTKPNTKPKGPLAPEVLFITRSRDGGRKSAIWRGRPEDLSASTDRCDVRMGPSWVRGDLDHYELHAEADGLSADLQIERVSPSWRPGAAVTYLDPAKTKFFAWVVPVPYGTAEGELTIEGESRPVKGTVYHDHNWGNFMLVSMLDHWYWGRAHVGDFSIIFVEMVTAGILGFGAVKLPSFYLAKGDDILTDDGWPLHLVTGDFKEGPGGRTYPARLDFSWHAEEGDVHIALRNPRLLESIDSLEDVPRWARPIVHLIMNPYYYDFEAELNLEVDIKGVKAEERGKAIYEQMLFHKKQK